MGKIFESTPAYQKGLIGEEIIKKHIEYIMEYLGIENYSVRRPKDASKSGASLIDFVIDPSVDSPKWLRKELIEVKVKSQILYAYRFPAYMFPKSQIEKYKDYAREKNLSLSIYIIDEEREKIFVGNLNPEYGDYIEKSLRIEDKIFPVDVEQSNGIGMYRIYSVEQFVEVHQRIDFSDLGRLSSIKLTNDKKKLFKRLQNSPKDIFPKDLLNESRSVVLKYFGLNLPNDLPNKLKKVLSLVESLRPKLNRIPTCFFYEIYHAVHNINIETEISSFVSPFYALLDEIKHKRQKKSNQMPNVIEIKNPTKKIAELCSPNNSLIEIFESTGNEPLFFIDNIDLYRAIGCGLSNMMLHDSIIATSNYYSAIIDGSNHERLVPIKDISVIVNEYSFNRVDEISEYDEAKKFLEWWEEVAEPYLEPEKDDIQEETHSKSKNNSITAEDIQSIGKIADSIMEVMGTTRQNALQAAIKIKSKECGMDLTPLIELLK